MRSGFVWRRPAGVVVAHSLRCKPDAAPYRARPLACLPHMPAPAPVDHQMPHSPAPAHTSQASGTRPRGTRRPPGTLPVAPCLRAFAPGAPCCGASPPSGGPACSLFILALCRAPCVSSNGPPGHQTAPVPSRLGLRPQEGRAQQQEAAVVIATLPAPRHGSRAEDARPFSAGRRTGAHAHNTRRHSSRLAPVPGPGC